jgi:hypothetical protein
MHFTGGGGCVRRPVDHRIAYGHCNDDHRGDSCTAAARSTLAARAIDVAEEDPGYAIRR